MSATLAPGVLLRGDGALTALGPQVSRLGSRPLIVRGAFGFLAPAASTLPRRAVTTS